MASLAGKADPTIVAMAYRSALANVPGDYSKHYEAIADGYKDLLEGIDKSFKSYKLNKELSLRELDNAMKVFDDPLAAQGIESDYYGMQKEVTEQREIWKANKGFKGDPEGRQNWDRKNRQIIGYAAQNSGDLQELLSSYEGDLYDMEDPSNTDITFVTNLAKYSHNRDFKSGEFNDQATAYMKKNPKATPEQLWDSLGKLEEGTMVKYKDPETGEHTYISNVSPPGLLPGGRPTVVTKKSSELKEIFNLKATGAHAGVQEMLNGLQTVSGNSGGKSYETFETNYKNELDTFIDSEMEKNDHTLRFLMRQKTGAQKMSFEDALRSGKAPMSAEIIATLGSVAGFEGDDGDGVLDAGDFATQKSYDAMVESILSGEIDKDLSKDLYIQHTSETVFKTGWNQNKKTPKRPVIDPDTGIDYKFAGGYGQGDVWITSSEQRRMNTSVRNKLQTITGADGYYYVLTGDKKNYMMFDSKKQYDELYKKGGALVGKNKGVRVDMQTVLDNNAAGTGQKPKLTGWN